jgi:cell division protein FtsW
VSVPAVQHPGELRWETSGLVAATAVLTVFGIASLYAAATLQPNATTLFTRQLVGAVAGAACMIVVSRLDYHVWRRFAWPLILLAMAMLLVPILPFPGQFRPLRNGAHRWIQLGPLNLQPSELARFAIVVWTAMLAAKKGEAVRGFKKGITPFVVVIGLVALLILPEPNLSTAVLVALLGGVVLFTAGARIGHFLLLGMGGFFAAGLLVLAEPYRLRRVQCLLEKQCAGGGFQLKQAIIGVGSGGAFGVGFGHGQLKLNYLPYAYSDFLASTIGEEWGFVGIALLALLFTFFCWLGFRIARTAPDAFGQYLATGLTANVAIAALLHSAVNLGLMPTTGLAMPFMSHGLSGLMVALVSVGVLVNIGRMRGRPARDG